MIDICSQENKPLLPLEQALSRITDVIKPVRSIEIVDLRNGLGRILAESLNSPINLPYERNAAMDGYAFASDDITIQQILAFECIGTSWAGHPFVGEIRSGQCIRIFTGAVIPETLDSVIMQEHVTRDGSQVIFPENPAIKRNVRKAGEDLKQGHCLINAPKKLSAVDLGLLASAGIGKIPVYRQLKIAHFSTGDELIGLDKPLQSGKIYDSNRYTLGALLVDPCYTVHDFGVLTDDKQLIQNQLAVAQNFDAIITTGGVSVGDADLVKEAFMKSGQIDFWKIAIKPGKPFAFGTLGDCYFFGLPGNPVAVITTYQELVSPALQTLAGAVAKKPLRVKATLSKPIKKSSGRQEFQRGIFTQDENGDFTVAIVGEQGSHMLSPMSQANCFIVLPSESTDMQNGSVVLIEPFH